jgi:hypothetical protein
VHNTGHNPRQGEQQCTLPALIRLKRLWRNVIEADSSSSPARGRSATRRSAASAPGEAKLEAPQVTALHSASKYKGKNAHARGRSAYARHRKRRRRASRREGEPGPRQTDRQRTLHRQTHRQHGAQPRNWPALHNTPSQTTGQAQTKPDKKPQNKGQPERGARPTAAQQHGHIESSNYKPRS